MLIKTFRNESSDNDVVSIVPLEIMKNDENFFDYLFNSNEKYIFIIWRIRNDRKNLSKNILIFLYEFSLGKIQVLNLKKIQAFATNRFFLDIKKKTKPLVYD